MNAAQPMADPAHSENPQHETERWLALWHNATPEAQWEALRILRAATAPRQKREVEP